MRMHVGDMSRWTQNARHTFRIKTDLNRYANELSSQRHQDLPRSLGVNRARHAEILGSNARMQTYQESTTQIATRMKVVQASLGTLRESSQSVFTDLLKDSSAMKLADMQLASRKAEGEFAAMVSALNAQVGGVSVFSGTRSDLAPLPSGEAILSDLRSNVDLTQSAADITADVDAYFESATGAFETSQYRGGVAGKGASIGDGQQAGISATVLDSSIRSTLAGAALAAIADSPTIGADLSKMGQLLEGARNKLIDTTGLASLESAIGSDQERVENTSIKLAAQLAVLSIELNELEQPDPFETAVKLQEARTQLETHFTVTGRLAEMSLLNYI